MIVSNLVLVFRERCSSGASRQQLEARGEEYGYKLSSCALDALRSSKFQHVEHVRAQFVPQVLMQTRGVGFQSGEMVELPRCATN